MVGAKGFGLPTPLAVSLRNALKEGAVQSANERLAGAERETVGDDREKHRDQAGDRETGHHGVANIFLAHQAAIKQSEPGIVIISTSAMEVSIHAVSPEFGAHSVSIFALHAGGAAASCADAESGRGTTGSGNEEKPDEIQAGPSSARHGGLQCNDWKNYSAASRSPPCGCDGPFDVDHENLAVADFASMGGAQDGVDHRVDAIGRNRQLDF